MRIKQLFTEALINLNSAKLRSFLAVLGILVGTAAVVALISAGRLSIDKALAEFKALGTNLLSISAFQKEERPGQSTNLTLPFWQEFQDKIPEIQKIAPFVLAYQPMSFQGTLLQGSIIAAEENLAQIIHIEMAEGRFVSLLDSYEHYCVIGATLAEQIQALSPGSPLSKQIRIGRMLYTVIGIARPWKENMFFNEDINQAAIVPINGLVLVNGNNKINNVIMFLKPDSPIDAIIETIKEQIQAKSPTLSVFPRSPKEIIASMESQQQTLTWLLAIIGSISLVVGGIGIMNVMLVSVTERKKEIGIRKALGAKDQEIAALFLMEAVLLSFSGGFLGVVLGLAVTWALAYFCDWVFVVYPMPVVIGFSVSLLTGVFFGYYPAKRASKLDAVVSLRAE